MPRKYVAFDIETAKEVPGTDFNWKPHRPIGIACAAALPQDVQDPTIWHGKSADETPAPKMSLTEASQLVDHLVEFVSQGYTVLTWNGLGFDFDVLAEESGRTADCQNLALHHVDMMFHVFCDRGFPVALSKAAQALRVPGKLGGMSGMQAPQLWAQGQHQQVMDYVAQDVRMTLQVAQACEEKQALDWITRKGSVSSMKLRGGWRTVEKSLELPLPDTSWMKTPITRSDFTGWIHPQ
jgi:hypothetical protein